MPSRVLPLEVLKEAPVGQVPARDLTSYQAFWPWQAQVSLRTNLHFPFLKLSCQQRGLKWLGEALQQQRRADPQDSAEQHLQPTKLVSAI